VHQWLIEMCQITKITDVTETDFGNEHSLQTDRQLFYMNL